MRAQTRAAQVAPRHRRRLHLMVPTERAVAGWQVALRGALTCLVLGAVTLSAALLVKGLR